MSESFLKGSWLARQFAEGAVPCKSFVYDGCGDRFNGKVWALRPTVAVDHQDALAYARKWLEQKGWRTEELQLGEIGQSALEQVAKASMLARALVDPADPTTLACADGAQVLTLLHTEEIDYLYEMLVEYQAERSPLARGDLDLSKMDEVLDDLGKELMPPTWWRSYGSASLARLLQRAASRLASPTKAK